MANPSPWAQVQSQAQPMPPDALAPVQMPDGGAPREFTMPQVFAPTSAPKPVALAPQAPSPEQQVIAANQAKLNKIQWQQANPWGTPNNHPGKLGKVAHVFSELGNIAGDIFAPATMANIPGTQLNREVEGNRLAKEIGTESGQESENIYRGAETEKTKEETSEMPAKAASEEGLQGAQTKQAEAETTAIENPQAATPELDTYRRLVKMGMAPQEALNEVEKAKALGLKPAVVSPEQQYLTDYAQRHPGSTIAEATRAYKADSQAPQRAPIVNMFVPNGQGGETLQTVRPGQTVAEGAQTAAGVNAVNTPTMTQRTAAGRAGTVVAMAPEVLARIDALAPKLGPVEGRWNDFMQGKVGMDDPDFASLRSDLLMMSSAVALAHAQGRLPENLRQEFDHAINAPQQSPENLKATIQTMLPWLQKMQEQAHPNQAQPQGGGDAENWVRGADEKLVKQ